MLNEITNFPDGRLGVRSSWERKRKYGAVEVTSEQSLRQIVGLFSGLTLLQPFLRQRVRLGLSAAKPALFLRGFALAIAGELLIPPAIPQRGKGVADVRMLGNRGVIQLESKAGDVGKLKQAAADGIPSEDQRIAPLGFKLAKGFLEAQVGRAHIKVQGGGKRHRSDGAVRRDREVLGSGNGRDFFAGKNPAAMRDIHLDNVGSPPGSQAKEVGNSVQSLTCGNANLGSRLDGLQHFDVV